MHFGSDFQNIHRNVYYLAPMTHFLIFFMIQQELGVTKNPEYKLMFMIDSGAMITLHTDRYGIMEVRNLFNWLSVYNSYPGETSLNGVFWKGMHVQRSHWNSAYNFDWCQTELNHKLPMIGWFGFSAEFRLESRKMVLLFWQARESKFFIQMTSKIHIARAYRLKN